MKIFIKRIIWFFGFWFMILLDNLVGTTWIDMKGRLCILQFCPVNQSITSFIWFVYIFALIIPLFIFKDDKAQKSTTHNSS